MKHESRPGEAAPAFSTADGTWWVASRVTPTAYTFPARIKISATADEYLDRLAAALTLGQVGLHQLEGGVLALALAVDTSSRDELRRLAAYVGHLEFERDLWHYCANNPGKKPGDYYRAQTARLWAEAVAR